MLGPNLYLPCLHAVSHSQFCAYLGRRYVKDDGLLFDVRVVSVMMCAADAPGNHVHYPAPHARPRYNIGHGDDDSGVSQCSHGVATSQAVVADNVLPPRGLPVTSHLHHWPASHCHSTFQFMAMTNKTRSVACSGTSHHLCHLSCTPLGGLQCTTYARVDVAAKMQDLRKGEISLQLASLFGMCSARCLQKSEVRRAGLQDDV